MKREQFSELDSWIKSRSRKIKLALFIFAILIALIPNAIRFYEGSYFPGDQAYARGRFVIEKNNTLTQSSYHNTPFDFVVYFFSKIIGYDYSCFFLSVLFTWLSLFFFDKIMNLLRIRSCNRIISLLLYITSPTFVYLSSYGTPYSMIIALDFLFFYLYLKEVEEGKLIFKLFLIIVFVSLLFFNWFNIIVVLLGIYSHKFIYSRLKVKDLFYLFFLIIFLISIFFLRTPFYYQYEILLEENYLQNLLAEFGSVVGFSSFILLLAIISIFYQEYKKSHLISVYMIIFLILATIFFSQEINIYINFIFIIYSGSFICKLLRTQYSIKFLKDITILLIIFGVVFSLISFQSLTIKINPQRDDIACLKEIFSNNNEVIFTAFENSFSTYRFSGKKTLVDKYSAYEGKNKIIFDDYKRIFNETNLEEFMKIAEKYKIKYILIDKNMKKKYWNHENQGLLFLLKNSETFKKICLIRKDKEIKFQELYWIKKKG